jgi:hypothetical protein
MFGPDDSNDAAKVNPGSRTTQWKRFGPKSLYRFVKSVLQKITDKMNEMKTTPDVILHFSQASWEETIVLQVLKVDRGAGSRVIIWNTLPSDVKQQFNIAVPISMEIDQNGGLVTLAYKFKSGMSREKAIGEYDKWFNLPVGQNKFKDKFWRELMPSTRRSEELIYTVIFGKLLLVNSMSICARGGATFSFADTKAKLHWVTNDIVPGFSFANFFLNENNMMTAIQKARKVLGLVCIQNKKRFDSPFDINFLGVDVDCRESIKRYLTMSSAFNGKSGDCDKAVDSWYAIFNPMKSGQWNDYSRNPEGAGNYTMTFFAEGGDQLPNECITNNSLATVLLDDEYLSITKKGVIHKELLDRVIRQRFRFSLELLKGSTECFPTQHTKQIYQKILDTNTNNFEPSVHLKTCSASESSSGANNQEDSREFRNGFRDASLHEETRRKKGQDSLWICGNQQSK